MLRWAGVGLLRVAAASAQNQSARIAPALVSRGAATLHHETDEQLDARFIAYFNRTDIDGWEVRKAMNDLCAMDLVPDPTIVTAAMKACRRVNDFSLAVRFLEAIKNKCGSRVNEIYPYVIQEIRPTLTELGINTPEELGYDKPELFLKSADDV